MGGRAIAYYMSTTVLAVILGIILVTAIQPGSAAIKGDDDEIEGVTQNGGVIISQIMLQGAPSSWFLAFDDIKTIVLSQYTQWCIFLEQEVREKCRAFVSPPRAFPLSLCLSGNSKFHKNINTPEYTKTELSIWCQQNLVINLTGLPEQNHCFKGKPNMLLNSSSLLNALIIFLLQVGESRNVTAADTLMDLTRNLLPPNLIQVSKSRNTSSVHCL